MEQEFSLLDYYTLTSHKNILLSYKGPVTEVIMAEIIKDIKAQFENNPHLTRKLLGVFIELSQNILNHSAERIRFATSNDSVGVFLLTEGDAQFTFSCGNLVLKKDVQELIDFCELINSMDRLELRELKREHRGIQTSTKIGEIGLIQVALTSQTPLQIEFREIDDDFVFFSISVKILKTA
jgi:hypothetical protein